MSATTSKCLVDWQQERNGPFELLRGDDFAADRQRSGAAEAQTAAGVESECRAWCRIGHPHAFGSGFVARSLCVISFIRRPIVTGASAK